MAKRIMDYKDSQNGVKDDNNGRLEFNMGAKGSNAEIYIRNVRIEVVE